MLKRLFLAVPLLTVVLAATVGVPAQVSAFSFNWAGTPTAPLVWNPPSDFDLLISNANDEGLDMRHGGMQAGHGADCSAPPATHAINQLIDTVFICNNHLMTAENDTDAFIVPNQLLDWSTQTATASFAVSTLRQSTRDWWEIWLMPFSENFASPTDNAPFYNGNPAHALHITMDQRGGCAFGQPNLPDSNDPGFGGTFFRYVMYNGGTTRTGGGGACMEDIAGGVSAAVRSTFTLTVSANHVTFGMVGANGSTNWINDNLTLPFNQAVFTIGHRSYDPGKSCGDDGTCGPNTFHWSELNLSPTVPFTISRPIGSSPVSGAARTVNLAQPAPANSFLRLSAFGNPQVAFDGGAFISPHRQDTAFRPEAPSTYFEPLPAGTTSVTLKGTARGGMNWWAEEVSVWSLSAPLPTPTPTDTPSPTPTATPTATPSPTPAPSPTPFACNLRYSGTGHAGTCLRNSDGSILFRPN